VPDRAAPRTLLLGMGNPILSDDAIGIRLAEAVSHRLGRCPDLDVVAECSIGGLNLLDVIAGYDRLLVFDSIKTKRGAPGCWYRFDASSLRETMNLRNVHDTNFMTALELGRAMGMRLPSDDDIHVFAVEIADNQTFSERLTPSLRRALPGIVEEMLCEVRVVLAAPLLRAARLSPA
jgi:hydrogenase maturation protease